MENWIVSMDTNFNSSGKHDHHTTTCRLNCWQTIGSWMVTLDTGVVTIQTQIATMDKKYLN